MEGRMIVTKTDRQLFPVGLRCILAVCLCLLTVLSSASEATEVPASAFLHPPVIEPDPQSPSGKRTTWKCVYFGAYPSSEVVDSSWNAVNTDGYGDRYVSS